MVESAKTTPVPVQEQQATPTLEQYEVEAEVAQGAARDLLNTPSLIGRIVSELSRPSARTPKKRR